MNWTANTRNALQVALGWAYSQKSEMGLIGWMKYLCPIDKTRIDNDGLIVDGLEVGKILKAVSEQRPTVRGWLEYCYGPDRLDFVRTQIAFDIARSKFGTVGGKRFQKHLKLCEAAVDDYTARVINTRAFDPPVYVALMGMKCTGEQWEVEWGRKRDIVLKPLQLMDREGVANVSITVKSLRENVNRKAVKKPNSDQSRPPLYS